MRPSAAAKHGLRGPASWDALPLLHKCTCAFACLRRSAASRSGRRAFRGRELREDGTGIHGLEMRSQ